MAVATFNNFKPLDSNTSITWIKRFNWRWVFQRSPILALAIDSSYNIAKYIGIDQTPLIIQIVCGITFDLIFIGMVALADQFRSEKRSSDYLFWIINGGAMLLAAIFGTLAYSSGVYRGVTAESITRGIAFPILGLLYNLFYHTVTSEVLADQQREEASKRKELLAKPYQCEHCASRFETIKQRNGHMARCLVARQQKSSRE